MKINEKLQRNFMESAFFIDIISIFSLIFTLTIIHKRSLKDRNKNYLLIAALIVIAQLIIDLLMSVFSVQSSFPLNRVFSLFFCDAISSFFSFLILSSPFCWCRDLTEKS